MTNLFFAALAFSLLHFLPGTPVRSQLIRFLGSEKRYLGLFAVLAVILLIVLIRTFSAAPFDSPLWSPPQWWLWLKSLIILAAFELAAGGFAAPNPSSPEGQGALDSPDPAKGALAVTRHPVMWGVAIWAAAHLVSEPNLRGLLFFGTFALVALMGAWLQQRRKARLLGEKWLRFERATSFAPFAAIIAGRARLNLADIGVRAPLIALVLWAAMFYLHKPLTGVPALPQL